jgi:hypothetical protein
MVLNSPFAGWHSTAPGWLEYKLLICNIVCGPLRTVRDFGLSCKDRQLQGLCYVGKEPFVLNAQYVLI